MSPLPLSRDQIAAIQARAEKATPGPWESDSVKSEGSYGAGDETQEGYDAFKIVAEIRGKSLSICDSLNSEEGEVHEHYGEDESGPYHSAWDEIARRNFDFIAHARTDIPALCQQALRAIELEAEIDLERQQHEARLTASGNTIQTLQSELTATRKALEEERERIAKHILEQREGGHCGEGSMEIIARQRNNADLKRAAEFVRLVPSPQVKP